MWGTPNSFWASCTVLAIWKNLQKNVEIVLKTTERLLCLYITPLYVPWKWLKVYLPCLTSFSRSKVAKLQLHFLFGSFTGGLSLMDKHCWKNIYKITFERLDFKIGKQGRQGAWLLLKPKCIEPLWCFLRVVDLIYARPGWAREWAKAQPNGARSRAPTQGLAPGWSSSDYVLVRVNYSLDLVSI